MFYRSLDKGLKQCSVDHFHKIHRSFPQNSIDKRFKTVFYRSLDKGFKTVFCRSLDKGFKTVFCRSFPTKFIDHFHKIQYDKGLKQHYIGSFQQIKG